MMKKRRVAVSIVSVLVVVWLVAPPVCGAAGDAGIEAITRPSADRTLSFTREGEIVEMTVKEGDTVKVDQLLVSQCTKVEKAMEARLKAQAEDKIRVDAQEAQLKQKELDLQKYDTAHKRGGATLLELEHARLEVVIAKLSVQLANFERQQAVSKHKEMTLQIERMSLRSPIDGIVEKIFRRKGEAVDRLKEVIRVVRIDPLWVDVPVPLDLAARLVRAGPAKVRFTETKSKADRKRNEEPLTVVIDGKVDRVAAVADAASTTRMVRVEVPNTTGRPAGEHVKVTFPPQSEPAKADKPK